MKAQGCNSPDEAALLDLYNSTNGSAWLNNTGWLDTCDVCQWYGVGCDTNGNVTCISLRQNGLSGVLPASIGSFQFLTSLDLEDNSISGTIPSEIGNLQNLQVLDLQKNALSGSIPTTIGNLINLTAVWLNDNLLTGSIPTSIGNLVNISQLGLNSNSLSGPLPDEIGMLSNLWRFSVLDNQLSGEIPASLGNNLVLDWLVLAENDFTGELPGSLGNLENLTILTINDNNLSGCFPASFENLCDNVSILFAHNNPCFTSTSFTQFCAGQGCQFGDYTLTASPSTDVCLGSSVTLSATGGSNYLWSTGETTTSISQSPLQDVTYYVTITTTSGCLRYDSIAIKVFDSPAVTITGTDVTTPGGSDGTASASVSGGAAPYHYSWSNGDTIATISGLIVGTYELSVTDQNGCLTTGMIFIDGPPCPAAGTPCDDGDPNTIDDQEDGNCNCAGTPCHPDFGIMQDLYNNTNGPQWKKQNGWMLDCEPCGWYGISCDQDGHIIGIDLQANDLAGALPSSLGLLDSLKILRLGRNDLVGAFPLSMRNLCAQLEVYDFSQNELTCTFEDFCNQDSTEFDILSQLYLSLNGSEWTNSSGWLEQCDPCQWYGIKCGNDGKVSEIVLPSNNLSGNIPAIIGDLTGLKKLDLSGNAITGTIPAELTGLANLNRLYLNDNQLVSPFPDGMATLCTQVQFSDLSNNLFYCDFDAFCAGTCEDCEGEDCDPLNIADFVMSSFVHRTDDGSASGEIEINLDGGVAPYTVTVNGQVYTTTEKRLILRNLSCGSYSIMAESSNENNAVLDIDLFIPQQIKSEYRVPWQGCLDLNFDASCLLGIEMDSIACVVWEPAEKFSDPTNLNTSLCDTAENIELNVIDHNGDIIYSKSIKAIPRITLTSCFDGIDNDGNGISDLLDPECQKAEDYIQEFDNFPLLNLRSAIISSIGEDTIMHNLWRAYGAPDWTASILLDDTLAMIPLVRTESYQVSAFLLAMPVDSGLFELKFLSRDSLDARIQDISQLTSDELANVVFETAVLTHLDLSTGSTFDGVLLDFMSTKSVGQEVCTEDFTQVKIQNIEYFCSDPTYNEGCPGEAPQVHIVDIKVLTVNTEFCQGPDPTSNPFDGFGQSGGTNVNVSSASPEFLERMENCNNFPGPEPDPAEDALCAAWQQLKLCAQGKFGQKNFDYVLERFAHQAQLGDGNLLVAARDHVCALPAMDRAEMEELLIGYDDMMRSGYNMSMSRFVEVAELLSTIGIDDFESIALVAESRRLFFDVSSLLDRTDLNNADMLQYLGLYLDILRSDEMFLKRQLSSNFEDNFLSLLADVNTKLEYSLGIPRAEYILAIDKISRILANRSTDYEYAADYLQSLLPSLIQPQDFTDLEVVAVYELAYAWLTEAIYQTGALVLTEVINAFQPLIALTLIGEGLFLANQVIKLSGRAIHILIRKLPPKFINETSAVWAKISSSAAFRPNTIIPDVFELTTQKGDKIYVQFSGTKHIEDLVTKNGALISEEFAESMPLRSQIVLDDLIRAVEEVLDDVGGPGNLITDGIATYRVGKWELGFLPSSANANANGSVILSHAVPKF